MLRGNPPPPNIPFFSFSFYALFLHFSKKNQKIFCAPLESWNFSLRKKTTLCHHSRCLSSVEISLERGSKRSAELIDLKIGLDKDNLGDSCLKGAISRNSNYKLQIYANCNILQINLCARFLTDLLARFC